MRVLVATNDRTFTPSLVTAYANRGWDVVTGVDNLYYQSGNYDLVHLHWPEELIDWKYPNDELLKRLYEALEWWRGRTRIIATVHNLLPHREREHPLDKELYRIVYGAADLIGHFSHYSLERVIELFADSRPAKHIVHSPHLLTHLLPYRQGRDTARTRLGLGPKSFVLLAFGAFRVGAELRLVRRSLRKARVMEKRLIFAGRLPGSSQFVRLRHRARFKLWQRLNNVISIKGYIPDHEVANLFDAADAVLIPRFGTHLNSGILPLAMTFGTPVVAPRYGIYAEYMSNSENELYEPGDADSMSSAIERLAVKGRKKIMVSNHALGRNWGWPAILNLMLPKLFETKLSEKTLVSPPWSAVRC